MRSDKYSYIYIYPQKKGKKKKKKIFALLHMLYMHTPALHLRGYKSDK